MTRTLLPSLSLLALAACGGSDTAGKSSECSAIAKSAIVVCSPVASSMSISRSLGMGFISAASRTKLSVTPPMAETTATISWPDSGTTLSGFSRNTV